MKHSQVRSVLYEYVRGELPRDELAGVADHLASCRRCARDADAIRATMELTGGHTSTASDQRSAEFWNGFATSVERRIQSAGPRRNRAILNIVDTVAGFFTLRPQSIAALGGVIALVVSALLLTRSVDNNRVHPPSSGEVRENPVQPPSSAAIGEKPVQVLPVDERIGDYFRRMKVLLVGIMHLKGDEDHPINLSSESKVSRELLDQGRYLKNQPLDIRSAKLVDDLQKVLIPLANAREQEALPNVELIRSGIHKGNLLFKIRMAEAVCDSSRFISVGETY
jgi:hypothetical protein